ncbi:DM13 domain-containing protein [Haloarculaceae archaeon H-GB2-1]|nr:DM13 domain-containing protein [Haloarculaceae archaeon H-GB1-1]MEA5386580.1 DM13 domain-containing protein [Haloarculaceae archaeon H-GB11]MEA5408099.1 DM13 domain-containing protein [Haloarculaceae archaeon H-GB2-1]
MTDRRTLLVGAGTFAVVAVLTALVVVGPSDFFLPERSTQVDEGPDVEGDEVLKRGTFEGTAGHDVEGTVRLLRDDDGLALRFENYSQTQGPDVFVYVTPSATPDTRAEIRAGTKVLVDGGADGGESTKEGTFTQRLPADVEPGDVSGVGIWCERFATPFGYAELTAATA